jgi:Domain of unknown function (DUF4345)
MGGVRLSAVVLWVEAAAMLTVGLNGLVAPDALLAPVGITLAETTGWNEARAAYGGMHLGLAAMFAFGAWSTGPRRTVLMTALMVMGGLVGGRLVSWWVDGAPNGFATRLLCLELVGALAAASALRVDAPA